MKIITLTCSECGTVVAGNVLEDKRNMKCPGLNCENVLMFSDLDKEDREHLLNEIESYRIDGE